MNTLASAATSRRMVPVWLILIMVVGALFRFVGVDWDEGQHLHPDERFITIVTNDITWPEDFDTYFDPVNSPLSPYQRENVNYVYGTFPLFLVKKAAVMLDHNSYDTIYLVGRVFSGIFDLAGILLLFLIGRRLYDDRVALLGSALYAICVLPIQLSHYYAMDTFANFFVIGIMYFAVRISQQARWWDYTLLGLLLGAGMASKLSILTIGIAILLAASIDLYHFTQRHATTIDRVVGYITVRLFGVGILALVTFRILQPIAFAGPDFLNFSLHDLWVTQMRDMQAIVNGERDIPPFIQWTDRPMFLFALRNMVLWGMGVPLGIAAWAGWIFAAYQVVRRINPNHALLVVYIGVSFVYHATRWVQYMRYFIHLYPFLLLLAAYLLVWLWRQARATDGDAPPQRGILRSPLLPALATAVVVGGTLLYALAFTSIYTRPHSRVEASRWIYEHVPKGAVLANEHWDDSLPLRVDGKDGFRDWYTGVTMNNYEMDTPQKLDQMVANLTQADYVILSSNRLYDSIPRLPSRYPMTIRYYDLLFAEQLGFEKEAVCTSYPQLFGIQLPDQSADESFSVYDHPKVTIFKKSDDFNPDLVRSLLSEGVAWENIIHMLPRDAAKVPNHLMLSEADQIRYQQSSTGTWAAIFDRNSVANSMPLVVWFLALQAIALLAFPITFVIFGNLSDRGYILSKALGVLLVSWLIWLFASWHLVAFSRASILIMLILLAIVSALIVYLRSQDIAAFLRDNQRLMLIEEGLFWLLFLLFVWVRWQNPDLWHPSRGGEKPMDFAYLNAIIKSLYFPPYDPWFAGGYINYYYFGFVLVATLTRLTGIIPAVAYNLAVPTFFAMTGMGAFTVAYNLVAGWPRRSNARRPLPAPPNNTRRAILMGMMAILFVVAIGNLGEAHLIFNGLREISTLDAPPDVPIVREVAQAADGLNQLMTTDAKLNFRDEWWYWNATRLIPHPPDEAGPINEFPLFTFLYADLHAHLMALPFTLLVLALLVNLVREAPPHLAPSLPPRRTLATPPPPPPEEEIPGPPLLLRRIFRRLPTGWKPSPPPPEELPRHLFFPSRFESRTPSSTPPRHRAPRLGPLVDTLPGGAALANLLTTDGPVLLALALVIGALWPMNTWDLPTYAVLVGAALVCREYMRHPRPELVNLWHVAWRWLLVVGLAYLLFHPFHQHYANAYSGAELWEGSRTPLATYLIMHGLFLFIITSYLITELLWGGGHNPVVRLLRLSLRHWRRFPRASHLHRILVRPSLAYELGIYATLAALFLALFLALFGSGVFALCTLLIALATLLLLSPTPAPRRQLILCLIGMGLLLTMAVEIVVLKGDIGRMNTVFKFYMQVWVLWGVASAAILAPIVSALHTNAKTVARRLRAGLWWAVLSLLLIACMLYPLFAIPYRIQDRFDTEVPPTLNGMDYMAHATRNEEGVDFPLLPDLQAIRWLQDNVQGSPPILEAQTPLYRWGGRVSIYTGLPLVIGWDWHQRQQRAILPPALIDRRLHEVRVMYLDPDPAAVASLLRQHRVEYIYVGPLEKIYYGDDVVQRFAQGDGTYWDRVYENPHVTIYRVRLPRIP